MIPERVHEALVEQFGEEHSARVRGCFISTSLRKLMEFLDPDDIHSITAERRINKSTEDISLGGEISKYTDVEESHTLRASLCYRRDAHHTVFDWGSFREWLDSEPDVHDMSVSEIVIRIQNEALRDQLYQVLNYATGFQDQGEFLNPFFAVMQSKRPRMPRTRRAIQNFHEPYYFKPANKTEDGQRGMNWPVRCLDLMALWSLRAWTDSGIKPLYDMTMHDIEASGINHIGQTQPEYCAINSKLVVNKWRSKFSRGTTDAKRWEWLQNEGWQFVGGDPDGR
jgi:hypothetical protein